MILSDDEIIDLCCEKLRWTDDELIRALESKVLEKLSDKLRDAERYEWIVGEAENVICRFFDWETIGGDYGERDVTLDQAIDSAIKESKQELLKDREHQTRHGGYNPNEI